MSRFQRDPKFSTIILQHEVIAKITVFAPGTKHALSKVETIQMKESSMKRITGLIGITLLAGTACKTTNSIGSTELAESSSGGVSRSSYQLANVISFDVSPTNEISVLFDVPCGRKYHGLGKGEVPSNSDAQASVFAPVLVESDSPCVDPNQPPVSQREVVQWATTYKIVPSTSEDYEIIPITIIEQKFAPAPAPRTDTLTIVDYSAKIPCGYVAESKNPFVIENRKTGDFGIAMVVRNRHVEARCIKEKIVKMQAQFSRKVTVQSVKMALSSPVLSEETLKVENIKLLTLNCKKSRDKSDFKDGIFDLMKGPSGWILELTLHANDGKIVQYSENFPASEIKSKLSITEGFNTITYNSEFESKDSKSNELTDVAVNLLGLVHEANTTLFNLKSTNKSSGKTLTGQFLSCVRELK